MLSQLFSSYFYLRQTIPLFLYVFYIQFRDVRHPIIDYMMKTGVLAIVLGITYTIMGCILGIPIKILLQFTWSYTSPITWGILFISYYYILNRKEENNLASFTLATLAVVGGGWLYEVPFFHPFSMFIGYDIFFYLNCQYICILVLISKMKKRKVRTTILIYSIMILCMFLSRSSFYYPNVQIICLIALAYELRKRNFKLNKLIVFTALLYSAFSIPLFLDIHGFWRMVRDILGSLENLVWFYRIPTSLFLLSLLSGIKRKSEMMKNV